MSSEATRIGVTWLIRACAIERVPRRVLGGIGVLAAGAVIVLGHRVGVDVHGGLPAGQILSGVPRADSSQQS
jgi:hypothetical protein